MTNLRRKTTNHRKVVQIWYAIEVVEIQLLTSGEDSELASARERHVAQGTTTRRAHETPLFPFFNCVNRRNLWTTLRTS